MLVTMIDTSTIDAVAAAALAHRNTVVRRVLGLPVRGKVSARIDVELSKRGIVPPPLVALSSSTSPIA